MAFQVASIVSRPQIGFWAAMIFPLVAIVFMIFRNIVFSEAYVSALTLPSSYLATMPTRVVFGIAAALGTLSILQLSLYIFEKTSQEKVRHMSASQRPGLASRIVVLCLGILSACCLGAFAFFTVQDGIWIHLSIHLALFTVTPAFFIACDYLLRKINSGKLQWVYDIFLMVFSIAAHGFGYWVITTPGSSFLTHVSIIGIVIFFLTFGRFPFLGLQIMGENFGRPSAAHLKQH